MSSNFTQHFKLNQWEKTDKVLMEDFNADNAKIDAAFFNHPSGELVLETIAESSDSDRLTLDVSQVDWGRYAMMYISVEAATIQEMYLHTNWDIEHCFCINTTIAPLGSELALARTYASQRLQSFFFPMYNSETCPMFFSASCVSIRGNSNSPYYFCVGTSDMPLSKITSLYAYKPRFQFQPGDKISLWGIK